MPRKKREWYPGAQYHIMCRGNHRAEIYRDDEDRQVYLTLLEEARKKYSIALISYCLMNNHVHLQVETLDSNPGLFMKMLNMKYAIFFNKKYNFVGHLFQGRYRSELIETDARSLQTSKYIHLNPVKANLVEKPEQYEWSSYQDYLSRIPQSFFEGNSFLITAKGSIKLNLALDLILKYFKDKSVTLYKEYVEYDLHLYTNQPGSSDQAKTDRAGSDHNSAADNLSSSGGGS